MKEETSDYSPINLYKKDMKLEGRKEGRENLKQDH
jgi:hypothetical protein